MAAADRPGDFDAFYTATSRRVVGYLYVVFGNLPEAEDAAHEAYARAWQRWPRVQRYDDPEAWVRTVAFRVGVSSWRKARNRLSAHRAKPVEEVPDLSPDRLAVVSALRRLPVEQRRVLVLHHMQGLTVGEISAETGTPTGTIKSWLARGRRALAPYVSEFADDEPPRPNPPKAPRTLRKGVSFDA